MAGHTVRVIINARYLNLIACSFCLGQQEGRIAVEGKAVSSGARLNL